MGRGQCGLCGDHGLEHGRESPGCLPLCAPGQGEQRSDDHPRGPAFHAHLRTCRHLCPVRAGSDIAFLGGLINYILENDLWFKEYVLNYTNISTIIEDEYADPSDLDGYFSGWEAEKLDYASDSWQYRGMDVPATIAEHYSHESSDPQRRKRKSTS